MRFLLLSPPRANFPSVLHLHLSYATDTSVKISNIRTVTHKFRIDIMNWTPNRMQMIQFSIQNISHSLTQLSSFHSLDALPPRRIYNKHSSNMYHEFHLSIHTHRKIFPISLQTKNFRIFSIDCLFSHTNGHPYRVCPQRRTYGPNSHMKMQFHSYTCAAYSYKPRTRTYSFHRQFTVVAAAAAWKRYVFIFVVE